jgi:hypothetical protein
MRPGVFLHLLLGTTHSHRTLKSTVSTLPARSRHESQSWSVSDVLLDDKCSDSFRGAQLDRLERPHAQGSGGGLGRAYKLHKQLSSVKSWVNTQP